VTRATSVVRGALKEPSQAKAMAREKFLYNAASVSSGKGGPKSAVDSLSKAGIVV